jgi:hypothetical protein
MRVIRTLSLLLLMLGIVACGSTDDTPKQIVINEVSAYSDQKDWFELYNPTDKDIDMADWQFSDNVESQTNKANFPAGTILKAGSYVVIELSDEWPGFKLGKGEQLGIIDTSGTVVASLNWEKEHSVENKSYGRSPDGTGEFQVLDTPTPGKANVE